MPDIFDMVGDATTTDKGTIYDYNASAGEAFGAGLERSFDTNPFALGVRAARTFSEDMGSLAGAVDRIDQKTAEAEVKSRGLDLKIPVGGITRYELDTLQYLKQREIRQSTVSARTHGVVGTAAGFAGGLAGSLTDPINVASNFIPFVSEYRYARWLAQAGESTLARAAVRVGAGAIEGAAGAAVVEPLVYAGATSEQLDYTSSDSFLNVAFGGIMGGGLHAIGGAVHDARVSRALRGLDAGIQGNDALRAQVELRDAAAAMPEYKQRELLHEAVVAMERGEPVDVTPQVARHFVESADEKLRADAVQLKAEADQVTAYPGSELHWGAVPEIKTMDPSLMKPLSPDERNGAMSAALLQGKTPEEWAKTIDLSEPVDVSVFRDGEIVLNDGHHRQYAAQILGVPLPVKIKAVNARPEKLRELIALQNHPVRPFDVSQPGNFAKQAEGMAAFTHDLEVARQRTPRDLAGLIEQSKADRTQAAFDRQFTDDGRAPAPKPEPKDHLARAKEDFDTANDIVEEFRKEGRLTAEDEAALKQIDEAVKGAELKAKAVEAAAACMVAL